MLCISTCTAIFRSLCCQSGRCFFAGRESIFATCSKSGSTCIYQMLLWSLLRFFEIFSHLNFIDLLQIVVCQNFQILIPQMFLLFAKLLILLCFDFLCVLLWEKIHVLCTKFKNNLFYFSDLLTISPFLNIFLQLYNYLQIFRFPKTFFSRH